MASIICLDCKEIMGKYLPPFKNKYKVLHDLIIIAKNNIIEGVKAE